MRAALCVVALLAAACSQAPREERLEGRISVAEALGGESNAGFARATESREFLFPEDHGSHPEFRTEWWYFTGNLEASDASRFGFQLTIFRHALTPQNPSRSSRWAGRDVWFGHFALAESAGGRFFAFERFERGALGLAGARADPYATWVGDWRAESVAPDTTFPIRLVASEGEVALELIVDPEKALVLQGDAGLSRKGPEPGNASYYYSATRLEAHGTVRVDGIEQPVSGSAWLDREWSTSALSAGQLGWDWFSIQLDDGRELMLYRLRREDGTTDPFNSGTLIAVDGSTRRIGADAVTYEPGRRWTSPRSGASYPVEWILRIESLGITLEVEPMLDASELDVSVRYWEGSIRVRGSDRSGPLSGRGFLEMTGYEKIGGLTSHR